MEKVFLSYDNLEFLRPDAWEITAHYKGHDESFVVAVERKAQHGIRIFAPKLDLVVRWLRNIDTGLSVARWLREIRDE